MMSSFPNVHHSSIAEISAPELLHNFDVLQKRAGDHCLLLPMVKANAYGHGAKAVTSILQERNVAGFGVANIIEALELRELGITQTIVSFGRISSDILEQAFEHNITVVLCSETDFRIYQSSACKPMFHLEIETGMHRLGIRPEDLQKHIDFLKNHQAHLKGVFSHFADAENPDGAFNRSQLKTYQEALTWLGKHLSTDLITHISNSGAILQQTEDEYSWARPGIALYGFDPVNPKNTELQPALTWKTPIIQIKELQAGDCVGYNCDFRASRKMKVATIAIGYGDGFMRNYQSVGVGFDGKRCPIVGKICMDLMMIDITDCKDAKTNDEVYLLGQGQHGEATVNEIAKVDQTISYEVLSRITSRVLRIKV